ncbi:MAG: TlpA family protein disulfide reductase [Pyrinomonadaceae bacterium]|nr:TlpA family protein disulfide reductase [Pyrinomonadaceae bacterium]
MKQFLQNIGLFLFAAIIFSGLTGCETKTNSQKMDVAENNAQTSNANSPAGKTSKSSEYPPAPAGVLQAEVKRLDNSVFKVNDLKGTVVLLNLWATWCGPCRAEMPELVALESELKDKGFKIIGLNVDDETEAQIKPFVEEMKLNYEIAWADENLYRELLKVSKFNGIPQSFLIDREGHLRGIFTGGSRKVQLQLRENVEKVVAE